MAPEGKGRRAKWLVLVLLFVLALAVGVGVFVRWPLGAYSKLTLAELAWAGVHGHSLTLGGLHVHYLEGGAGKPVVLVHGLGGQSQDWARLMPQLVQAGFHVYAPDLPGFGETSKPRERTYSIREQAGFVEAFLEAKGLDRVRLVGVSMGGWVAATVALDAPQRVEQLVLIDSAGLAFKPDFDVALFAPKTPAQVDALLALLMPRPDALPTFVKEDLVRQVTPRGWVIERALVSMGAGADVLDGRLSSLQVPLLLLWGKQDLITPLALGEAMHKAVPASTLEVFDGCGHLAFSNCSSRVGPRLIAFLTGTGTAAGGRVEVPTK
jgi:pimeloyl-ACP methyl ester carboxylesterase